MLSSSIEVGKTKPYWWKNYIYRWLNYNETKKFIRYSIWPPFYRIHAACVHMLRWNVNCKRWKNSDSFSAIILYHIFEFHRISEWFLVMYGCCSVAVFLFPFRLNILILFHITLSINCILLWVLIAEVPFRTHQTPLIIY